jgi:hypothetical protein
LAWPFYSSKGKYNYWPLALFTKILTIKNSRTFCKCKTKIKKSFTKILRIILSVKIVLTLRVKLPCRKCKILNVREIFCLIFYRKWKNRKKRWTMYWRFGLKIREQFTVGAFSLTVCQTSLHILINVYWNKYGLIQTDATNDTVVYSFLAWLITESITMHSVHLPFQCSKVYRLHINYHMTKKNQDNSFNFRFQIGNGRQSERLLANLGEFFFFIMYFYFFLYKNNDTGFSSRHLLQQSL